MSVARTGFSLEQQLSCLPADVLSLLAEHHFNRGRFLELARRLAQSGGTDNRLACTVEPPRPGDVEWLPDPGSPELEQLRQLGSNALARGQVALLVMAGGMATRMGGVVKALVPALPGRSFLDLRLAEQQAALRRYGARPPLWFMASQATASAIGHALAVHPLGRDARVFVQDLAPRLCPDGSLYRDKDGAVSLYATGHGDVIEALRRSSLLEPFALSGGRTVFITNLDNLGATLDPAILGWHLAHGQPLTSEVVDRLPADRGGLPVRAGDKLLVLEELRWPQDFDPTPIEVFNINSFWFDAAHLLELRPELSYFAVNKQHAGQPVIQFERLLNQVVECLPTRLLRVPRSGPAARFLPVKDAAELRLRQPEIECVATARGHLD